MRLIDGLDREQLTLPKGGKAPLAGPFAGQLSLPVIIPGILKIKKAVQNAPLL